MNEITRVEEAYRRRKEARFRDRYSLFNKAYLQMYQQRERVLLSLLNRAFDGDLRERKLLDIGCGIGGTIMPMLFYGILPKNCFGIDILSDRIEMAKEKLPNVTFECCSAQDSSFEKASFDLITMFTCLSSVLDMNLRRQICRASQEMLKPGGWALVYDFVVNNPSNPDVKAVKLEELKEYFPNSICYSKKLTLLPPLGRLVGKYSYSLCSLLSQVPFLQTHRMTMFQETNTKRDI